MTNPLIKSITALVILLPFSSFSQKKNADDIKFKKHVLLAEFVSEGAAVGDINKDGKTDVIAGAYWFEAPAWQKHEISKPVQYFYDKGYSDSFIDYSMDVNNDGWTDVIIVGFPGKEVKWFENPKNKPGHWKERIVFATAGNESPGFYDMDNDGRKDLLCADVEQRRMIWVKAPKAKNDTVWTVYPISENNVPGTERFSHGLGYGDINKDGKKDVIIKEGWWEAPSNRKQASWKFHEAALGENCSQMHAIDVDKDGDNDVISCSAHTFGIWWHEQVKEGNAEPSWKTHLITKEFSQTHATSLIDINKDGNPDLVTGKRYFAHMGNDPGEFQVPVLYWFEFKPGKEPQWVPHLIDDDSGVGTQVLTEDITKDKLTDIIVANKKGVFVFEQIK